MSKVETLRSFVNKRLTAAAEEIFELFERTIGEYEEQLRSKEEQHNLLDSYQKHDVGLHISDVQLLMVRNEEEVPTEQQEWNSRLNQEDPPEPPHIKEEQEELWTSQDREQLQEPEEADISMSISTPVPVKTEEDGEDCGGSEPDRDFIPDIDVQKCTPDKSSHLSGSDTDDSGDWDERDEPQECLKPLQNKDVPVSDMNCNTGNTSAGFSECATSFGEKKQLKTHRRIQTGEKPFSCSVCGKEFGRYSHLRQHSSVHTGKKLFFCSICGQRFTQSGSLNRHSKVHTGEKPFSCSVCGKGFTRSECLKEHSILHSGEKPFSCSVCDRRFTYKHNFRTHKCVGKSSQNE